MILHWMASPEWAEVVKTLLNTLWQAALAATGLALVLRRRTDPVARYRYALAALASVATAGLVTWAVLSCQPAAAGRIAQNSATTPAAFTEPMETAHPGKPPLIVVAQQSNRQEAAPQWTAWLALAWLVGAGLMLARAGLQVAGAERLRRRCRPLENPTVAELASRARQAIGLTRQVRLAVTERLTSPAVVGVLVPTLIVPLTLVTTLTPDQIRFVLLHELAHVRRGDYVASLFQLLIEALLFFNPAVWWISRQIRVEREACCDALATELSGDSADYARALVQVAERLLDPLPAAAAALGGRRRSSLGERVRRLLVPGYRPALRLTWRAMTISLLLGGALLFLSAVGTRFTVAAILSPQQRIDRIERKMVEYGQPPRTVNFDRQNAPRVQVSGRVRMADGSPVPKWVSLNIESSIPRSSWRMATAAKDGDFRCSVRQGTIYIAGSVSNFAPVVIGPFETLGTNRLENVEVVLERGFDTRVVARDADTGKPIPGAVLSTRFWWPGEHGTTFPLRETTADGQGEITLSHCGDLPLVVTLEAPGYEIVEKRFAKLSPGEVLRVAAHRGAPLAGMVLDKKTGKPIADATVRLLYQAGPGNAESFSWKDPLYVLATTDSSGYFLANRLRRGVRCSIGVTAPGRESVLLQQVLAGRSNLVVRLGPELVIHGRVTGDLDLLKTSPSDPRLYIRSTVNDSVSGQSQFLSELHEVEVRDGIGYFQFTNRLAQPVTIEAAGHTFKRDVSAPVADWLIDLGALAEASLPVVKREVVFRFQSPSGVPPRGTVHVTIPENLDPAHLTAVDKEMEITNGEVRVEMPVGGRTDVRPGRTIGYWFKTLFAGVEVTNGPGPMVIDIPLVPAGAIYARARNADGSPAADLMFSVVELKRSALRDKDSTLGSDGDSFVAGQGPRQWISGPLPLGGTYEIVGSRGNSFCVSKPITLTEEKPDAEVELQFAAGRSIDGVLFDPAGKPIPGAEVIGTFTIGEHHSYGLRSVFTDERGHFRLENAATGIGQYSVQVGGPGCRSEIVPVDFAHLPMTVRLKPGLKLSGQVVEAGTGYVIPDAEIRAWTYGHTPPLPSQTVRTDAHGDFQFDTLGDAVYMLYVNGANLKNPAGEGHYQAGQSAPIKLQVVLYPGSSLAPKAPGSAATALESPQRSRSSTSGASADSMSQAPSAPGAATDTSLSDREESPGNSAMRSDATAVQTQTSTETNGIALEFVGFEDPGPFRIGNDPVIRRSLPFASFRVRPISANGAVPRQAASLTGQVIRTNSVGAEASSNGKETVPLDKTPGVFDFRFNLVRVLRTEGLPKNPQDYARAFNNLFAAAGIELQAPKGVFVQGDSIVVRASFQDFAGLRRSGAAGMDHLQRNRDEGTTREPSQGIVKAAPPPPGQTSLIKTSKGRQDIIHKLQNIRLKSVSFDGQPLSEVIPKLSEDARRQDPENTGVNFFFAPSAASQSPGNDPSTGLRVEAMNRESIDMNTILVRLEPALTNTRLLDVLDAIVRATDTPIKYSIVDYGVVFSPERRDLPELHIRTYRIETRTLLEDLHQLYGTATNAPLSEVLDSLLNFFDSNGLNLHPGTGRNLFLNPNHGTLIVRGTEEELGKVEKLLELMLAQPPQVNLRVRFVEIPGDANAPGFDWYLGNLLPKNASSSEPDDAASRSTAPNSPASGVFPGVSGSRLPASASGPPGNRVSAKAIVGILTEPQYRVALHALEQREGASLLNEGQVTTLSGRQAQIQMVHLHSAPTRVKPQALMPPGVASSNDIYEVARMPLGPVLDVVPTVRNDGVTIELKLSPSLTEFLGYDPVTNSVVAYVNGKPQTVPVPSPRFRVHAMSTDVILWDGQTAVLGNLPEVSAPRADDPSHPNKNLLVFVTATLIDPAGNRIHTDHDLQAARNSIPPQPGQTEATSVPSGSR